MSNWYGQDASVTGAFMMSTGYGALGLSHDMRNPTIGSGICNECFFSEKEKAEARPSNVLVTNPQPTVPQTETIYARIHTLNTLLISGLISKEEYDKRKQEIIAQI